MPIFEYLGPFDAVEVDEAVVHAGETVEVTDERADTFRLAIASWREIQRPRRRARKKPAATRKRAATKPRPAAEDTTENTEES